MQDWSSRLRWKPAYQTTYSSSSSSLPCVQSPKEVISPLTYIFVYVQVMQRWTLCKTIKDVEPRVGIQMIWSVLPPLPPLTTPVYKDGGGGIVPSSASSFQASQPCHAWKGVSRPPHSLLLTTLSPLLLHSPLTLCTITKGSESPFSTAYGMLG